MTAELNTGRTKQKERTRRAIVDAARELVASGSEVTMSVVATAALVSEATAYRYFPDLASLLAEAVTRVWPTAGEALTAVADTDDPVARIGCATEALLRDVHSYQSAVRAMIAASVIRPDAAALRPARRFGLIDEALAPFAATLDDADRGVFEQLKQDLSIVVSAEAFFNLTDLCGLAPAAAIASAAHAARTLTAAAVAEIRAAGGPSPA